MTPGSHELPVTNGGGHDPTLRTRSTACGRRRYPASNGARSSARVTGIEQV